jgi:uncharacterized protein
LVVGLLRIDLFLPETTSLKDKRQIVKSIIGKVENRFNVSISEVANQELWRRATIGIAHVAERAEQNEQLLNRIDRFIEALDKAIICERQLYLFTPEQ